MRPSTRIGRGLAQLLTAAALTGLIGLSGCGGKPPKVDKPSPPAPPPVLRVEVTATGAANRGPGGQALPIVVRLYELKAQGAFSGADFFSLYDQEAKALAGELIAREELTLAPGQNREIVKPLDPQARYLGVLGAFRDIDRASWRGLVPLVPGRDNNLAASIGPNAIRIEPR